MVTKPALKFLVGDYMTCVFRLDIGAIFLLHKIPVNANNCATRKRFKISLSEHRKDDHA